MGHRPELGRALRGKKWRGETILSWRGKKEGGVARRPQKGGKPDCLPSCQCLEGEVLKDNVGTVTLGVRSPAAGVMKK